MDDQNVVSQVPQEDMEMPLVQEAGVVMTFRLQIPSTVVGAIIGKSGEIIKSIRDQSGARVIIADSQPGEDRDVTIRGNLQTVDQAVNLILTNICQIRNTNTAFELEERDENMSLKVLVANDQAGAIIGKGGEVIKQLREDSGATISVGKKVDFVRTVSIHGNVNTIRAALVVLVRLVHDHPSSARDPFFTGYRYQHMGYRASPGPGYYHNPSPFGTGIPPQPAIVDPQQAIFPEQPNTLILTLPHRSVGSIIGKRGSIINEIRAISGCRVDIADMSPDTQCRTITLIGTPQCIEIAQVLIQKYAYHSTYDQSQ